MKSFHHLKMKNKLMINNKCKKKNNKNRPNNYNKLSNHNKIIQTIIILIKYKKNFEMQTIIQVK